MKFKEYLGETQEETKKKVILNEDVDDYIEDVSDLLNKIINKYTKSIAKDFSEGFKKLDIPKEDKSELIDHLNNISSQNFVDAGIFDFDKFL